MRITSLLHEISHQLGAADHYCYDKSSSDCDNPTNDCYRCDHGLTSPPTCIMSARFADIENIVLSGNASFLYCDQCKSSTHTYGIPAHLKKHHK